MKIGPLMVTVQRHILSQPIDNSNKVLSWNLPGGMEKTTKTTSFGIASFWVEILTWDLPNMKQECHPLDHGIQ
jgi:hypothetical protein